MLEQNVCDALCEVARGLIVFIHIDHFIIFVVEFKPLI